MRIGRIREFNQVRLTICLNIFMLNAWLIGDLQLSLLIAILGVLSGYGLSWRLHGLRLKKRDAGSVR